LGKYPKNSGFRVHYHVLVCNNRYFDLQRIIYRGRTQAILTLLQSSLSVLEFSYKWNEVYWWIRGIDAATFYGR